MMMLLKDFRLKVLDGLLDLLWSQWTTLGVRGRVPVTEDWILDPEALILFTCSIGRYDPRLFDAMLGWLSEFQRFVNIQRLRTINRRLNFDENRLLSAIARLLAKPASKAKWENLINDLSIGRVGMESLFLLKDGSPHPVPSLPDKDFEKVSLVRQEYKNRGSTDEFRPDLPANLIMKLRALFGLNSRCELLAYLLAHSESNPTEIADAVGYSSKTLYNAISEMYLSGTLIRRVKGRETLFRLDMSVWETLLAPGGNSSKWINWPVVFRAYEKFWERLNAIGRKENLAGADEDDIKLLFNDLLMTFRNMPESVPDNLVSELTLPRLNTSKIYEIFNKLTGFLGS